MKQLRRRLELLVLEQAPHERFARILVGIFLRRIDPRQQHARLDVDERRRHHQELPRHVQVEVLHQVDVVEVLLRDDRDRDVVDVHLVLLDEVQQQIQRPLELGEPDRIGLEDRFKLWLVFHIETAEWTETTESFLPLEPTDSRDQNFLVLR